MNSVRKHCSDEEVVASAKILIKNWKRLLGERCWRETRTPQISILPEPSRHLKPQCFLGGWSGSVQS